MKVSWLKLPAMYGSLYWVFAAGMLGVAGVSTLGSGFSLTAVAKLLLAWQNHWWWLALIGLLLHVLSYAKSLSAFKLMALNTLGACVFVAYVLIPQYLPLIMLVHLIPLTGLRRYRRPAPAPIEGG